MESYATFFAAFAFSLAVNSCLTLAAMASVSDLKDHGQREPALISRASVLVNGNTRQAALKLLGWERIRVGVLPGRYKSRRPPVYRAVSPVAARSSTRLWTCQGRYRPHA